MPVQGNTNKDSAGEDLFQIEEKQTEIGVKAKRVAVSTTVPFKQPEEGFNQRTLFPTNIFDVLPDDHDCYMYSDILGSLDVSELHKNYSVLGQNAYDPKTLISILIYSYSQRVFSSRQIAEKLHLDLGFMYISKLQKPDFRVLSDFRKDNIEFFKKCFHQTVKLAFEIGLVKLGQISIDGSKFKASTSKHKAMSYGRLKAKEKELTYEVERLIRQAEKQDRQEDEKYKETTGYEVPEDLRYKQKRLKKIIEAREAIEQREEKLHPEKKVEDKKQISFSDQEAPPVISKGEFSYSYNGQISVDSHSQIIVGEHVSQSSNDKEQLEQAIEEIKQSVGELPEDVKVSIDNGYFSGNNLETLKVNEIDGYVACSKGEKESGGDGSIKKDNFEYHEEDDYFICPEGNKLEMVSNTSEGKKIYKAKKEDCDNCPMRNKCCRSKKGEPRIITTDRFEGLRQEMKEKMNLESSKEIYRQRKVIVEPVFGQIKQSGFRGFSMRGKRKVAGEFSLICAVHNIKKIVRALKDRVSCPDPGISLQY